MNPNKKAVISHSVPLAVLFILCIVSIIMYISLSIRVGEISNRPNASYAEGENGSSSRDISAYEIAQDNEIFVLREHEGIIGIFGQSGELLQTVDVYVKTLPEKDRQLLREGISAGSRAELLSLIEDYSE